jgi:DNA polymerase I-like protein with 3'-5' exonuclease and polymerase domains
MTQDLFKTVTSHWVEPTQFPQIEGRVAIDLETCDPDLIKHGPGWPTKKGKVIGIAIATASFKAYYPIAHEGGGNMDEEKVVKYIKSICDDETIEKVFHNAQYDIGWLWTLGIDVKGKVHDTMVAAALIDENRYSYTLNSIVHEYLGEFKNESKLKEAAEAFGVDAKSEMYKLPAMFVGEYAEADADLTYKLHEKLSWEIVKDNLTTVYDVECRLIKVIFHMTRRGVRFDTVKCEQLNTKFHNKEKKLMKRIKELTNLDIEIWAAASIAKAFDALNLPYERTEKTDAPSFTKMFLTDHPHELPRLIMQARELNKLRGTFLHGLMNYTQEGRIHAHINQIRSDTGGTVSGRFSYNHPNLQQVPSRGQFAKDVAGVDRRLAKTIGLGVMYGMGYNKLARELDLEPLEAKEMLTDFRKRVPFMQGMLEAVMNRANSKGVIRTLLGRKCRFDLWEPTSWGVHKPLPLNQAKVEYGDAIKRYGTYKALNRLIQGSAADQTKKAMVDVYENLGIIPLIQVHDELDCSVQDERQAKQIKDIMETCVELEVPSKVDVDLGESWGDNG